MILLNNKPVELKRFPDGTLSFRVDPPIMAHDLFITWKYDGDEECMALWYLVHHLRRTVPAASINLEMPYIPNARMDRVKKQDEVFTLKWFAEFLNSMFFDSVLVLDAHSNVSLALIDNVVACDSFDFVTDVMTEINHGQQILFCYPDEGAAKRNSEIYDQDYVFGIKHRDWRTGKIERLEITTPEKVVGKDILIIDDICSKGGTFTHTAKALKSAGAADIYLYVAHCENTIFDGTVLTDGLIKHVFTTDSIFRGESDIITVFK